MGGLGFRRSELCFPRLEGLRELGAKGGQLSGLGRECRGLGRERDPQRFEFRIHGGSSGNEFLLNEKELFLFSLFIVRASILFSLKSRIYFGELS